MAQWDGRTDFTRPLRLDFFEAGEVHSLLDTGCPSDEERADPEMQAVNAAAAGVAAYVELVAKGGKGWVGYRLHPAEPTGRAWRLIEWDTEFSFWNMEELTGAERERRGLR